jgi:hypothetical protein
MLDMLLTSAKVVRVFVRTVLPKTVKLEATDKAPPTLRLNKVDKFPYMRVSSFTVRLL